MINWITSVLTAPFRVVADLGSAALNAIKTLWHALTALGRGIKAAWGYVVAGAKAIGGILERVALDVYNGLKWLIAVQLPKWARWAASQALKAAAAVVNAVKAFATNLYHLALAFATKIVNTLAAWAHDAVSFLTRTLADAWNLLRTVARIVGDLLTDAEKLALWLVGAMARALLRFVVSAAVPIARYLFGHLLAIATQGVDIVESIIADIIGS